jgi:hypothetical protein
MRLAFFLTIAPIERRRKAIPRTLESLLLLLELLLVARQVEVNTREIVAGLNLATAPL